jgi:hypothetical protein
VVVNFNLLLPCLALLWMVSPGGRQPGNAAAASTLRFAALVGFIMHAAAAADLLLAHELDARAAWRSLAAVAAKRDSRIMPANFMMFDFLGLLGAAVIFAAAECGVVKAAGVLVKGLAVGPGAAFALAAARREERLAAGAAQEPPKVEPTRPVYLPPRNVKRGKDD